VEINYLKFVLKKIIHLAFKYNRRELLIFVASPTNAKLNAIIEYFE